MRKIFYYLLILVALQAGALEKRVILTSEETKGVDLTDIPGLGPAILLGGDSLVLAEDSTLTTIHLPFVDGVRQIITTDNNIYCASGNWVCRMDTTAHTLVDVAVIDNEDFTLAPSVSNSFFVCTSDSAFSSLILFDPDNEVYSPVFEIETQIDKVMSNSEHLFLRVDDKVIAVGDSAQVATIFVDPTMRDVILTPYGFIVANEHGLVLMQSPVRQQLLSRGKYRRIWHNGGNLYLLDDPGNLLSLDGFDELMEATKDN